jgi:hypothetical protein
VKRSRASVEIPVSISVYRVRHLIKSLHLVKSGSLFGKGITKTCCKREPADAEIYFLDIRF